MDKIWLFAEVEDARYGSYINAQETVYTSDTGAILGWVFCGLAITVGVASCCIPLLKRKYRFLCLPIFSLFIGLSLIILNIIAYAY
jgi:hypothetical protein